LGGLGERFDDEQIDVDVWRPGRAPTDAVGDVVCGQWFFDTGVNGGGLVGVPSVSVQAELLGAHHPRGDLRHAHWLAVQFEAKGFGQRGRPVFGGGVAASPFVHNPPGGRANDDDVAGSGRDELGQ
jgi:hypothetical protein